MNADWLGKPYYSLDAFFKATYGEKCYKIALNAGLTCPNRDGRVSLGGCAFCSTGGSGDFAMPIAASSIEEQLAKGRAFLQNKKTGRLFVAYFQAYTNTYGPISYLEDIFTAALALPDIVGISIATRPDCLGDEVLALLVRLREKYPDKFIWVELGLQTIHEKTAIRINRGFPLSVFEQAVSALTARDIPFIVHLILGLPGETFADMEGSCSYLNSIPTAMGAVIPFGVKLQLLHILRGTPLGEDYAAGRLNDLALLNKDAYIELLIRCLELLNPDIIIHRLTGDGPRELLLAPFFSLNKRDVLNTLHQQMKQQNTYQGRCFHHAGTADFI